MENNWVIFEATAACIQSFKACLVVKVLMKNEWAENRLADFNLWASGIGASVRSRASLDSRLALRPEARDVIANLLRLLSTIVDECKMIALSETTQTISEFSDDEDSRGRLVTLFPEDPAPRSFSPWSDDSASDIQLEDEFESLSSSDPLHKNIQDVENILDQLARIAVALRRSGRRSRLQKADQRFKSSDHEDLQKHLTTILLARPGVSTDQIDISKLSEVQQRLIHCNLKRRNRFLYAQQHSKWLDPGIPGHLSQTQDNKALLTTSEESTEEKQKLLTLTMKTSSEAPAVLANPTIKTGTSASAVSKSLDLSQELLPKPAASTIMSSTVVNLKYPRPPKIDEGARVFMCPCCCQTLPVALSEGNRWKKHLVDDLTPYTCILPECDNPEALFSTKETWRRHLLEAHRSYEYWLCFACGDGTRFNSGDAFILHTKTIHAASVKLDQISLLGDICKRSTPMEIKACPLCHWPNEESGNVDQGVLLDHIAKGIHSFSLRALPWADDNGQETDERINTSADKVYDWLIKTTLSRNPNKERPFRDNKIYYSDHFQRNAYFASSSVASSSSELESFGSIEEEHNKLKQEGSISFGSRKSGDQSQDGADDGDLLYAQAEHDDAIRLNTAIGAAVQTLEGHSRDVNTAVFSPNGKQIVSASDDKTVRLWDITGAALQTLEGHSDSVYYAAFSPNGKQIVSASYDNTLRLWDTATGAALQTLEGHSSYVYYAAFSPDGKQIVSASDDKTVRLWDIATGAALQTLEGHSGSVNTAVFSPNGKQIVSASNDKTVRLWDTATGAALQTLEGHSGYVYYAVFSPNGKQIVSASYDKTVRLWDTATGAALQTLEGHSSYVYYAVFSPDGKQIVSASYDNTLRLWNTATGAALQTLEGHSGSVYYAAFSPNSKLVVSASTDNTIRLWDITGAAL